MNCCICAPVKNCGPYLHKIFENIEKIASLFNDYTIIFYYDKSEDDTLQKLKEYAKKNNKFTFFVNQQKLSRFRTHNIANARNGIIQRIKHKYSHWDYFIMLDADDKCALELNKEVLEKYLKREDWDALSFDHPTGYYDFWALSITPYIVSCDYFKNKTLGWEYITNLIQHRNNDKDNEELIPCWSAFNGFAIYRTRHFLNCSYDGRYRMDYIPQELIEENIKVAGEIDPTAQKNEDCEHRSFHFEAIAKNNARIRISPLQLFSK